MHRLGLLAAACAAVYAAPAAVAATLAVAVKDGAAALSDAVVYALPLSGRLPPHGQPTAVIDQVNKEFVPLVSVIQTGTLVTLPNRDNIRHHVYSFSPPKVFELKLYSGIPAKPVLFDKPGLVVMGCNIHDTMIAYVMVVDTPWFAKSADDGTARIEGLPAGQYDVHVWHYRQADDTVLRDVKVDGDTALKTSLELRPGGARPGAEAASRPSTP